MPYASPNVSSIARSITSGLRWLYISVTFVLECPRISEITRRGTPCIESHEPVVWRHERSARVPVVYVSILSAWVRTRELSSWRFRVPRLESPIGFWACAEREESFTTLWVRSSTVAKKNGRCQILPRETGFVALIKRSGRSYRRYSPSWFPSVALHCQVVCMGRNIFYAFKNVKAARGLARCLLWLLATTHFRSNYGPPSPFSNCRLITPAIPRGHVASAPLNFPLIF
jgi:hypothetical protein